MGSSKFVTGSVLDSEDTSAYRSFPWKHHDSFQASAIHDFADDQNRAMFTFSNDRGPTTLLVGRRERGQLKLIPGPRNSLRARVATECDSDHATKIADTVRFVDSHESEIEKGGESCKQVLKAEDGAADPQPSAQHTVGLQKRKSPPFVPAVMVGWMHTSTDRGLFVDAEDVEDPDEILGPLPREIQMAGHELEEEFRRHRSAIVKLGRRRQPFFVDAEAATMYKSTVVPEQMESYSQAKFELSQSAASKDRGREQKMDKTTEIVKVASLKTGLSLLCAFPERCCLVHQVDEIAKSAELETNQDQLVGKQHNKIGQAEVSEDSIKKENPDVAFQISHNLNNRRNGNLGTPVYSVPGVYVTMGSSVGPIRMKPLFLCEEQLESMLEAGKQAYTQAALAERRMNRDYGRQKILRAFAGIATGGRPVSQQSGDSAEEEDDDGALDPPEVNEFLGEMGEGPSNRGNGGFGAARGPIGVISTAACGVLAMGLGAAGAIADLTDKAIFATSAGRFLMGHYLPLNIEQAYLEEKVAEAAEHNQIHLVASRGQNANLAQHLDVSAPDEDQVLKGEHGMTYLTDNHHKVAQPIPEDGTGDCGIPLNSKSPWRQQLDDGLNEVVRRSGLFGSPHADQEITERLARILMRNRHVGEVLERLDDGSFTNADVSSIGVILHMAAMVSSMRTSPISDSSMEMVLSTRKQSPEVRSDSTSQGSSTDSKEAGAGPDVTNMEISQKDDGEPDKFRFEISNVDQNAASSREDNGISTGKNRKTRSSVKHVSGESDNDASISIEIDLREALGDLADDLLGDVSDTAGTTDSTRSLVDLDDQISSSKQESDTRVQGFVLVGDLLAGQKNADVPVDTGNIVDVTQMCSISVPYN